MHKKYMCIAVLTPKICFMFACKREYFNLSSIQKYHERKQAFEKAVFKSDEDKEKWAKVINVELMSSEESDTMDDNEILIHRPITWLSSTVRNFKARLDEEICKKKSPQAKRQRKERVTGAPSTRPLPIESENFPKWIFSKK